jgi:hypothetical protein
LAVRVEVWRVEKTEAEPRIVEVWRVDWTVS